MDSVARRIDNDTRGWILTVVSGIACVFGAAIICFDAVVRLFPGKHNFRIQESNVFLACSLSLSFGVMLFSSLYSMLPESKEYLENAGWGDQPSGFLVMTCFVGGFVGIQAVSRYLHQHIPSHVVDCDHSHVGKVPSTSDSYENSHRHSRLSRTRRQRSKPDLSGPTAKGDDAHSPGKIGSACLTESTPLLDSNRDNATGMAPQGLDSAQASASPGPPRGRAVTTGGPSLHRRPSVYEVQKRVVSFVKDTMCDCDEEGLCYGYTDPCGQECFKHMSTRSFVATRRLCTTTRLAYPSTAAISHSGPDYEQQFGCEPLCPLFRTSWAASRDPLDNEDGANRGDTHSTAANVVEADDSEIQHHHHVATNAFLSIGLQTSIAIALHKFPEGFITYATNHANPNLGFNFFMALFVHNITEGFAMALPLYMALGSRWRAMLWSFLLGGLSQPVGAAVAALWFKLARRTDFTPNAVAYACLFAITAGIMVSVALQLFVEGLSLNHNRKPCIFFGFLGMTLLGVSNAFFAAH